jgi:signal transduction histidine kinase
MAARPSAAAPAPAARLGGGLTGRMLLASGLLMLILAATFAVLLVAVGDLRESAHAARNSEEVLTTANELERLVIDVETSVRGFALTGEAQFLQPWDDARRDLPARAAALERLSAGNPEQQRAARRIAQAASAYVERYAAPLLQAARRGDPAAGSVATIVEGKRRVDEIRAEFDAFIATQRSFAEARQARSDAAATRAAAAAVGGLAVSLVLVAIFAGYLTRAIVRPVLRAAQMAVRMAGGDLSARMPATGVAEIGRLERAFNQMAGSLERNRDDLAELATEQAALRRVATLVARGVAPELVFAAVAEEVAAVGGAEYTTIYRFEPDGTATVMGSRGWSDPDLRGRRWRPVPPSVTAAVLATDRAARFDGYATADGLPALLRREGVRSGVGSPILVEGRLWGAMVVLSAAGPLPPGTEERMVGFTELVATAIANAESRAELAASRARVVAAADETRRRLERDLHDGAQQRLVSLALRLRTAATAIPPDLDGVHGELADVGRELDAVLDDLRELSRGIHPAILFEGGLGPALRTLARRSAVPVELRMGTRTRLPERVEVTAYYVVAEALTNVARHSGASEVRVDVNHDDGRVRLAIRDDGVGGADPSRGSGLIGLKDRVEATGGTLLVDSRPGHGTSLLVELPVDA